MFFIFDFSWNLKVLWGFFNKIWVKRYIQLSFTHVCKYLNQRVTRISEKNGKSFKGVSKTKNKKKTHMKRLSFITQFKIEFLLLLTGWRKMLGKMPECDVLIYLNVKNNFLRAFINSVIFLSKHSCALFLILISLLGTISLTTFINLLRKSMYAASIQEKRSQFEKLIFCNSSRNT